MATLPVLVSSRLKTVADLYPSTCASAGIYRLPLASSTHVPSLRQTPSHQPHHLTYDPLLPLLFLGRITHALGLRRMEYQTILVHEIHGEIFLAGGKAGEEGEGAVRVGEDALDREKEGLGRLAGRDGRAGEGLAWARQQAVRGVLP
jgi:hypothetical protein